jgi:hypothetical protein
MVIKGKETSRLRLQSPHETLKVDQVLGTREAREDRVKAACPIRLLSAAVFLGTLVGCNNDVGAAVAIEWFSESSAVISQVAR